MGRFFELVDNPLVKALAGLYRGSCNFAVKLRRKTEVELTRVRVYSDLFLFACSLQDILQ